MEARSTSAPGGTAAEGRTWAAGAVGGILLLRMASRRAMVRSTRASFIVRVLPPSRAGGMDGGVPWDKVGEDGSRGGAGDAEGREAGVLLRDKDAAPLLGGGMAEL